MKVLVGVDGSTGGFEAVREAGRLLTAKHDQVGLYYAPPELRLRTSGADPRTTAEKVRDALVRSVFDEARSLLPESLSATVHEMVGTQHPRHGLIVAADEWRADMVAVGARGMGPMKRILLGSVSTSVVQTSTLPVLVVRQAAELPEDRSLRVLLADDGSASSRRAGAWLNRLTWPAGTVGRVMHVVESLFAGELPAWLLEKARDEQTEEMARMWVEEHEAAKKTKYDELLAYRGELPTLFQEAEPIIAEGHAADQIVATIESEHIDLVVLGTRGTGVWRRLLIGSTTDKVIKHAKCSVLIVPLHEHA